MILNIRTNNLLDPSKVVDGYLSNTGEIRSNPTYRTTGFIAVSPNSTYKAIFDSGTSYGIRFCLLFDSDRNPYGMSSMPTDIVTDENTAYVRITFSSSHDASRYGIFPDGTTSFSPYYSTLSVQESESSYRYRAIMQKPTLTLKFSLAEYIEIPVGAQCTYQNETFTLLAPPNIKKNGERNIEYTLTMGSDAEHLSRYKLRNNEDGRLKWAMTATPAEFVRQIVLNLNARDGSGVWSAGTCLEAKEKTIEFNHSYLLGALNYGLNKILTAYPKLRVIVFTPAWRYMNNLPPYQYENANGDSVATYTTAIKNNCARLGISVWDFNAYGGRNEWSRTALLVDDSHYNIAGYKELSEMLTRVDGNDMM